MDMGQYLEVFIEESKEHLQNLNTALLELEKSPEDALPLLNEIFRSAHTLKGMSGTMGFTKMTKLTHDMENVLHALRNNELVVDGYIVNTLFDCLDALENYVNTIINTSAEGDSEYADIINKLDLILKKEHLGVIEVKEPVKEAAAPAANTAENTQAEADPSEISEDQELINKALSDGMTVMKIEFTLNKNCLLKAARAFIIFNTLERHGEIIRSDPKVQDIEDEKFEQSFSVILIANDKREVVEADIKSISEVDSIQIDELVYREIKKQENTAFDGNIENKETQKVQPDKSERKDTAAKPQAEEAKTRAVQKNKTGKSVRVDIERLDVLMNLVGELIITKTRLEDCHGNTKSQEYMETIEYLERVTTNLNDAVMKVRMVPVESVFNRFPRMVRDTSRELNKEIVLTMSGEETELDRTFIDEIGDPLMHLLRNSIDHGIESAEKRREVGKPETGHIYLRAIQDGNTVVIEVEDDGGGINVEKVKAKSIEKGLITAEIAAGMSNSEAVDMLFKAGFSTADKISDVSGRGVGLDVVKTKIETLGGNVTVETEQGKGSKFIIRLPLTLAIYQSLLVMVEDEKFAIPINTIEQIYPLKQEDIKYIQKKETILIRDTIVPLIRIKEVLDVPDSAEEAGDTEKTNKISVVAVKKGEKVSGLIVDKILGQQEVVIKTLGKMFAKTKHIAGATIIGDGKVALIIDVNSIV